MSCYADNKIRILVICQNQHLLCCAAPTGGRIEDHRNLCLTARRYFMVKLTNVGPSDLYHFFYLEGSSSDILDDETVDIKIVPGQISEVIEPFWDFRQGPALRPQFLAASGGGLGKRLCAIYQGQCK